ncbi:MAG: pentapeptide repeat-containing protein [Candidatus Adiutrix sp.]|nr:pentapeptide repeat-containing protein [Candidatus Adiutrix sp.]
MSDIRRLAKPKELFEEGRDVFNKQVAAGKVPDFAGQNLSDLDLTGFNLKNADLSGCYLRGANLAGVDLSEAKLHGASLKQANISGCLFPADLGAEEIRLSVEKGARIRHRKD